LRAATRVAVSAGRRLAACPPVARGRAVADADRAPEDARGRLRLAGFLLGVAPALCAPAFAFAVPAFALPVAAFVLAVPAFDLAVLVGRRSLRRCGLVRGKRPITCEPASTSSPSGRGGCSSPVNDFSGLLGGEGSVSRCWNGPPRSSSSTGASSLRRNWNA
jgi:hypothetical protein